MKSVLLTVLASALFASGAAFAQAPAANPVAGELSRPETKSIGDWLVRCFPIQSASPCDMFQEEDAQANRQRVLSLSLAYVPSLDSHGLQISVPLDIAIPRGITIQTDSYTSPVLKYRRCDRNGCYVELPVDKTMVEGLNKSGPDAKVNLVADNGKAYGIKFSLKGFSAAYDDMVSQARAKAKTPPKADGAPAAPAATP